MVQCRMVSVVCLIAKYAFPGGLVIKAKCIWYRVRRRRRKRRKRMRGEEEEEKKKHKNHRKSQEEI